MEEKGSVQTITSETGDLVQRYVYSSFGKLLKILDAAGLETNEIKTSFTFSHREFDEETGLYYYRARYYDANLGRFLQEDLHPGKISIPISKINEYSYSHNSPTMLNDPSGNSPEIAFPPDVYGRYCGNNTTKPDRYDSNFNEVEPVGKVDETCYEHDKAYESFHHWFSFNRSRTKRQFHKDLELAYHGQVRALEQLSRGNVKDFLEAELISIAGWGTAILWSGPRYAIGSLFAAIGITL